VTVLSNGSFNWEHVPWRRPALFDHQPGIADRRPPPNPCPAIRVIRAPSLAGCHGGIDGIAAGLEKDSPRMHDMIDRRVRAFLQGLARNQTVRSNLAEVGSGARMAGDDRRVNRINVVRQALDGRVERLWA
jgi:hypothetical protein